MTLYLNNRSQRRNKHDGHKLHLRWDKEKRIKVKPPGALVGVGRQENTSTIG